MSDRYEVVRLTYAGVLGKTHLLDTTIPEPRHGGDHSGIVCDRGGNIRWSIPDGRPGCPEILGALDTLGTMADEAGAFGWAAARWDICARCYGTAWRELLDRAVANSPAHRPTASC